MGVACVDPDDPESERIVSYHALRMNRDGTFSQKGFGSLPSLLYGRDGSLCYKPHELEFGFYLSARKISRGVVIGYFNISREEVSVPAGAIKEGLVRADSLCRLEATLTYGQTGSILCKDFYAQLRRQRKKIEEEIAEGRPRLLVPRR